MSAADPLVIATRTWGARAVPFNGQGELFATAAITAILRLLEQSAMLRSVMLLSGENGVGKSALAGRWLRSLEPKCYLPISITQASLGGHGLLAYFIQKLGKAPSLMRHANLKLFEQAFAELGAITPVLVIDEAQNLSVSALEEVRMLLGLNLAEQPAFALILVGDSYLINTLRLRSHRALYSRIAVECRLPPLTREEVTSYLLHQLRLVGLDRDIFEPAAIELLAAASEGVARTLNLLAREAWIRAAADRSSKIIPAHVQAAIEQVPGALHGRRNQNSSLPEE